MRILLVGDDAVAHAVAEQLARNCELYALMEKPNPGIAKSTQQSYVCDFSNIEAIGGWALRQNIDLVFITAEEALYSGLADAMQDVGFQIASPTMAAATIGSNRVYARNLLRNQVSFSNYHSCKSLGEVKTAIKDFNRVVLKPTIRGDWQALRFGDLKEEKTILKNAKALIKQHGSVIIEERLDGEDFSMQALSDGKNISFFPTTRAAKHSLEGDSGENTEGMGSYSTGKLLPFVSQDDFDSARSMIERTIAVLRAKGIEYKGAIHTRFIISPKGVKLIDIHSRFDNPEGINCMGLLKTQFAEVIKSIADGRLTQLSFSDRPSVVKYAVPIQYPARTKKKTASEISLDEKRIWDSGCKYYFDRVERKNGKLLLTDHRAVAVFAMGDTLEEAEQRVTAGLASISGNIRWRKDIATKQYMDKRVKRTSALKESFLYMRPAMKK